MVDQRRRRDFQIPRADAKLLPAEIIKLPGRRLIERNDFELVVELEQQGQLAITDDLPRTVSQPHGNSQKISCNTIRGNLFVTRVLLSGVACVGKSTIGAELARSLEISFFDLDKEVEAFYHETIPRLQARFIRMSNYRGKACRVLKEILRGPTRLNVSSRCLRAA